VHSAVLRLHVRPSVCLSVTLVDQDHIRWKTWKLIPRTISPTPSLFAAQKPSTYSQGNMGKFGRDYIEVHGVGKSGALEHKSGNISETRKDRGKVTMESLLGSHKRSFERYHPRPPTASHSPRLGARNHPKTAIAIIARTAKATGCKFG